MGEFMAGHLLDAGHELTVHNRTREREEALAARGARSAETPREAAAGAELVCLCVSDSPDVEAIVLGADGIAEGIASGAVVLDCSTIAPATAAPRRGGARRARRRRRRRAGLGRLRGCAQGPADGVRRRRGRARRDRPPGARGVLQVDHPPRRPRARARPARPSTRCSSRARMRRSARGSRWASRRACRWRRSSRRSAAARRARGSSRTAPAT